MPGLLRHWYACQHYNPAHYMPWYIGPHHVGWMRHDLTMALYEEKIFEVVDSKRQLRDANDDVQNNTELLQKAAQLLQRTFFPKEKFWNEAYDVKTDWEAAPLAQLDRTAMPWFGAKAWGLHVNGYVKRADGVHLWIGQRAPNLVVDPGKLDHLCAGGQPSGLSLQDNLLKEAAEEANLPPDVAGRAKQIKCISYRRMVPSGLRNDGLFVYDLELPEHITPKNTDGELTGFTLMPAQKVLELVETTNNFKFNVAMVIIDFMLRHGIIPPTHPEYDELKDVLG